MLVMSGLWRGGKIPRFFPPTIVKATNTDNKKRFNRYL